MSAVHDRTTETILARRSIRRYGPEFIARDLLLRLLECAVAAPSAHNRQPWRFVVLTSDRDKEQLATAMGAQLRADRLRDGDAPAEVDTDVARSHARLTQAPTLIVVAMTLEDMDRYVDDSRNQAERVMAIQSTAMAVQNLLLAAQAEALGACWMCAPLFCAETVRRALDLAPDWEPQAIITLGHPVDNGKPFVRRALSDVVCFRDSAL